MTPPIAITPEIELALERGVPVCVGVSGGKDGSAAALATFAYMDERGYRGERLLVHSDLGLVEWNESLPTCQRLADRLGVELLVVRRRAGGLMERWETRWASSVRRYENLETVTLVLPWSTPSMRFCQSELKAQVIGPALRRRFAGAPYINVTGVRRDESPARKNVTISDPHDAGGGYDWRPIANWSEAQVFARLDSAGVERHEAYVRYGLSRVSCRFCIMQNAADQRAAAAAAESAPLYRRMVDLEIRSAFAFQGAKWLGDVAPGLLSDAQREGLDAAKRMADMRRAAEARIPKHLLYEKGWPTAVPSDDEAETLAVVRQAVGELYQMSCRYLSRSTIRARYEELLEEKARKAARKAARRPRVNRRAAQRRGHPPSRGVHIRMRGRR